MSQNLSYNVSHQKKSPKSEFKSRYKVVPGLGDYAHLVLSFNTYSTSSFNELSTKISFEIHIWDAIRTCLVKLIKNIVNHTNDIINGW